MTRRNRIAGNRVKTRGNLSTRGTYRATCERRPTLTTRLGIGVYGVPEASRLAHINSRTAGRWFSEKGKTTRKLQPDYKRVGNRYAASFLDLIDLMVFARLREQQVPFSVIWRCYRRMASDFGPHPFCGHRLQTDGVGVFRDYLDQHGEWQVEDASDRQAAIGKILRPFLTRVDYHDAMAVRWRIADGVVIDPTTAFGKPVVQGSGITTSILASAYYANGKDYEVVSDLYEIDLPSVKNAVRFEDKLRSGEPLGQAA